MAHARYGSRLGDPPSPLLLIPITLIALVIATLFLSHWWKSVNMIPPERQFFDGLPIAGTLADARREGFIHCMDFNNKLRCRRDDVRLLRYGPFKAAVDLDGGDGHGGFRQITLWHDRDQDGAIDIGRELKRQGWSSCLTSLHNWGDQHILRREGSPVRVSIDLSYYGKRRIRIMPERFAPEAKCV